MPHHSASLHRKRSLGHRFALLLSSTLALSTIISTPCVHAQAPGGTRRMGYAVLNDVLYIQGGFDATTSSQFVSLDLSNSWSTSSPAWTKLKDGPATTHLALAPISSASNGGDKGSLLSIGGMGANPFFSSYDVSSESWQTLATVKAPYTYLEGHAAVSDPHTGLVYIVGGFGNSTYNLLSVYDPKTKTTVSQASATAATSLADIGAVWLNSRNTILTFGGTRATPATPQGLGSAELNEYDPSSKTWRTMSTSGDVPPARLDHCMAASEDGSKVVVFGGTPGGDDFFDTIYVLDVKSGKWKQGASAAVSRTRMACAFHSYQFIAWGGSSGSSRTTMLNNLPVVYNLNSDKWTDNYNVNEKPKNSSVGIIVGVVVAIVVILVVVGLFLMKKRRQRRAQEAYRSDALTAAAISSRENVLHDSSIKVAVENYNGYDNEYPMNKLGGSGMEKQQGYGTPQMHSPEATYHSQQSPNPFASPADFVPPPPSHHYQSPGSPLQAQHPYAQTHPAKSSPYPYYSPSSTRSDPFQQGLYSPAYSQTTTYYGQQSPAPGARSPQAIPDSANNDDSQSDRTSKGYIPPPPM